ncbi:MAG: hypothetical protein ACYTEX_24765 [Planctomycetota bacterium]|jgi:hypothetical protein
MGHVNTKVRLEHPRAYGEGVGMGHLRSVGEAVVQEAAAGGEPLFNSLDYTSLFYDDVSSYDSVDGSGVSMESGTGDNTWNHLRPVGAGFPLPDYGVSKTGGPSGGGYFWSKYYDADSNNRFILHASNPPDGGVDPDVIILTFWMRNRDYKYKAKVAIGYSSQGSGGAGVRRHVFDWTNVTPNPDAVQECYWELTGDYDALDPVNTPEIGQTLQHMALNRDGTGFGSDGIGNYWLVPNWGRADLVDWDEWGDAVWHRMTWRFTKESGAIAGTNNDGRVEMWYDGVKVYDWIGDSASRPEFQLVAMAGTSQRIFSGFEFSGPSAPSSKWSGESPQTVDWGEIRFFTPLREVAIPAQNDWIDQGSILSQGSAGQWDARLDGMLSPCTVIRKDGTLYLYYVGADGNRADGGPKNRTVGVATSTDGLNWTKYGSNPIIEYSIDDTAPETGEGGTFCAGGYIENNGIVNLFHGGIDEFNPGAVHTDIVLATSSDGLTFANQGIVLLHGDTGVIGDDELSPIGVIYVGGKWWVYYSAKGSDVVNWTLTLASSDDKTNLNGTVEDVAGSPVGECIGCGDPIKLSESKILVPILDNFTDRDIEMRTTTPAALNDLSTLAVTYDFSDLLHATIYLDRSLGKWFMYYINDSDRTAIRVRTAPMVYV